MSRNAWIHTQVCLFDSKPVLFTLSILFNHHNPQVVRSVPNQSHFPSEKREVTVCFTSQSELGGARIMFSLSIRCFSSRQTQLTCYIMNVTLMAVTQNLWVSIRCSWFLRIFNITTKVASLELRPDTFLSIPGHLGNRCQVQFLYLSQNPLVNPMSNDANNIKAQHQSLGLSLAARTPSPGNQQDFVKKRNSTFCGFPLYS